MKKILLLSLTSIIIQWMCAQEVGTTYTPVVTQSKYFDVSPPIREIAIPPQGAKAHHQWKGNVVGNKFKDKHLKNPDGALPAGDDPLWQKENGSKGITTPIMNFEGTRNSDNGAPEDWVSPPDTEGDVGPSHYFQMCNVIFQIFDKSGTSLLGPLDNSTIWDGFVGSWTGTNDGDPIVLYDEKANRWLVSQFAVNTTDGTFWELIAISTSGDPTGSYYRYAFEFDAFPDYPKLGVWRDGYYIMVQHGTSAGDVTAAALNRNQMIAGNATAQMVSFAMPNLPGGGFIGMLPSDNDGDWAPVGAPNYFVYFSDDAWGDDPVDRLKIWEFSVNWTTPALSSLTLATNLNTTPFDSYFGSFFSGWITQPVTSQKLAVMEGALMHRLQYRNFGSYQSMVCCHTVDVNGSNRAGVRWYELRKTTGSWYIYQEGTYSPGTSDNYWMASIAQNGEGDIALGFSVSGTSTYPSIKYTGRNFGDALGVMTLSEQSIFSGSAYQFGTHRWGDYSMMSVDPTDDKTFWYTNEYINSSGTWSDWVTRIGSFSLGDFCSAGGGCEEYISNVAIGSINNSSGCNGYADYTSLSTNVEVGTSAGLTVTNGVLSFSSDQCGVWVDWNRDGDFSDANETISVTGTPGVGPYTAQITPPAGTIPGECTMRIRITYTGTVSPCGVTTYGEVEDYTILVTGPNIWTGTFNHYWHNANNWSAGHIPTASEDVIIPNTGYQPVYVDDYPGTPNEACLDLLVESGATLNFYNMKLIVNGNMTVEGEIGMVENDAYIDVMGNAIWNSGSSLNVTATSAFINAYGDWNFNSGATVNPTLGFVDFRGTTSNWIRCYSENCNFYNLRIYKTGGAAARVSNLSTQDLDVNNLTFINTGAIFQSYSNYYIVMKGAFNYYGTFDFTLNSNTGSVVFDGTSQTINNYSSGTGVFNNVVFSSSTGTTVAGGEIHIAKNLTINQGFFSPGINTVHIGGNWSNTLGTAGFTETGSHVVFNGGNYHQYCSSETFNILEVNKASGGALRMNGTNVVCAAYDWTAGAVDVLSGSFTANDLLDNAIKGAFYNNTGGTINLFDSYVDLAGELHNYGGTYNLTGGISWWPFGANAVIEMNAGVIDLTSCGIYINHSATYSLTDNITGGTIRTAVGFSGNRADFTPAAGIFEFYGPGDAYISQSNGCTLPDVVINKTGTKGMVQVPENGLLKPADQRKDVTKGDGSKANSILLSNNFTITNNLTIEAGSLNLSGYQLDVAHVCDVYGTLNLTNPADVLNVGTVDYDNLNFHSGSTGNFTAGTVNLKAWIVPNAGSAFTATAGNTINFIGNTWASGLACDDPSAVYGNVVLNKTANRVYLDGYAIYPIVVNGQFTVNPGNIFEMQDKTMILHGTLTDYATSTIYAYNAAKLNNYASSSGSGENKELTDAAPAGGTGDPESGSKGGYLEMDNDFTLNGLLDVGTGDVIVHGEFGSSSSGSLIISGGTFIADSPHHPTEGWEYLNGSLAMTSGLFEITNNSIYFGSTALNSVSGGIIRTGGAFSSAFAGVFEPTGGTVELAGNAPDDLIYCGNGNFFYNLTINRSPGYLAYLAWYDIFVKNDLTIQNGILNSDGYNILIGGDWYNNVGYSGFEPTTGTVTFQSLSDAQDVWGSTTFNNVVQLYSSAMNYLRFEDANIISGNLELHHFCWAYDQLDINGTLNINDPASKFTANGAAAFATIGALDQGGTILCNGEATIYVNDLLESGLYGTITLQSGTFTIYQDDSQYIDLNANLTIQGGVMNVYGITGGVSYWPYTNAASITMSGGVLDIKELGVIVIDSYPFGENITGGIIRTVGDFDVQRNDFTPAGGTLEFYDGADVYVKTAAGSNLYNLLINKSGGSKGMSGTGASATPIMSEMEFTGFAGDFASATDNTSRPKGPPQGSKSNAVHSNGMLKVSGTTTVDEGILAVYTGVTTFMGNVNINAGANLYVFTSGTLAIDNGKTLSVNNGGILQVDGGPGVPVTVTRHTGYYGLNVETGGYIAADNCVFEYMNTSGVNVKAGGNVWSLLPFSGCTFQNGQTGGTLLTIDNSQVFDATDAVFPVNTWGGSFNVTKTVNNGTVNFVNATGDFSGEAFDNDPNNRINWSLPALTFDFSIFLEGPFDPASNKMKTGLNGLLPTSQPYDPSLPYYGNAMPDWYYGGTEAVAVIPNEFIVDWVVVQLRDATSAATATPATAIATQAAFVNNVGEVVGMDGLNPLTFALSYSNNLYAVIWHRNHLGVISANALVNAGGMFTYDFTTGSAQALGGTNAQKQLATGLWGLMAGDGDATGGIATQDRDNVWDVQAGEAGYKAADYNFTGQVNNPDKNDKWLINLGKGSFVPE